MVKRLPARTRLSSVRVRVMTPLSFRSLAFEYTWYCLSTYYQLGRFAIGVGYPVGKPRVESGLSTSSNEADCVAVAGAKTYADPEASYDHETPKKLDAPSSCVADPEGVLVSVRSSSDREAVTTPDATFLGVALVVRATCDGVVVLGGTYSGSCSSLEPIMSRADEATDFERPRA